MHIQLSQNKKILITAIVLFTASFSVMFAFLSYGGSDFGQVSLLGHQGDSSHEKIGDDYADLAQGEAMGIKYREMVEAPKDAAIFTTDPEGIIGFVCEGFCSILNSESEEKSLVGTSLFDYVNSEDLPVLLSGYTSLIHDLKPKRALGPFRLSFSVDEAENLVLLSGHPILDEEGKVNEIIFVIKDLTDQVENLGNQEINKTAPNPSPKVKQPEPEPEPEEEAPKIVPNEEIPSIKELENDPSEHVKLAEKISYAVEEE